MKRSRIDLVEKNSNKGRPVCKFFNFPIDFNRVLYEFRSHGHFHCHSREKDQRGLSRMLCESFRRFRNRFDRQWISVTAFYVMAKVDFDIVLRGKKWPKTNRAFWRIRSSGLSSLKYCFVSLFLYINVLLSLSFAVSVSIE